MKTVSEEIIRKRAKRTGDGTRYFTKCIDKPDSEPTEEQDNDNNNNTASCNNRNVANDCLIWGWDDIDMDSDEKKNAIVINSF